MCWSTCLSKIKPKNISFNQNEYILCAVDLRFSFRFCKIVNVDGVVINMRNKRKNYAFSELGKHLTQTYKELEA